jgi:DNA-binding GntR family transcriptional regulator
MTVLDDVLDAIRERIASGSLGPGERIMQDEVADSLGVSRVPVREAMKVLEGEGRLTHVQHYGYYVVRLSGADLRELVEARGVLEEAVLSASLEAFTKANLDEMLKAESELETAVRESNVGEIAKANRRFHLALIRPAKRPQFERLIGILWESTDPYQRLYFADESQQERIIREHKDIVKAVQGGDEHQLLERLRGHRGRAINASVEKLITQDGA